MGRDHGRGGGAAGGHPGGYRCRAGERGPGPHPDAQASAPDHGRSGRSRTMIRYDLICDKAHAFDGWFRDSEAYDAQRAGGEVQCPVCGSTAIDKRLMTPGIAAKANRRAEGRVPVISTQMEGKVAELIEAVRKLRRQVEENADYVGDRFAEEARKIHYNEV